MPHAIFRPGDPPPWLGQRLKLPAFDATRANRSVVTLTEAARVLGVCNKTVRKMIEEGHLAAVQVVAHGPFEIDRMSLDSPSVRCAVREALRVGGSVRERAAARRTLRLPGLDK